MKEKKSPNDFSIQCFSLSSKSTVMKKSLYNFYLNINGIDIVYNTLSTQFMKLTPEITAYINEGSPLNKELECELENKYFILQDDIDERQMVKSIQLQKRFSSKTYVLILNTTLDCNLNCWYCYEKHPKESYMTIEMVERILKHINLISKITNFEILDLTFFGGEPLMNYKAISTLLDKVQQQAKENNFKIALTVVSNGTLVSERYIDLFKPFSTRFQITIDGDKEMHNSIRKFKNENQHSSYERILNNLKLLNNADADFIFTLRINYDDRVLSNIDSLIKDLSFMDRRKAVITLQKVWQCNDEQIDIQLLFNVIDTINKAGFCLNSFRFKHTFACCNTDNFGQAIINYDGSVYKCTARDFDEKARHGYLNSLGIIEWDTELMKKRLSLKIPNKCQNCEFLPCCPGICTQKIMENTNSEDIDCPFPFDKGITKEDIVLLNLKQQLIAKGHEKK